MSRLIINNDLWMNININIINMNTFSFMKKEKTYLVALRWITLIA